MADLVESKPLSGFLDVLPEDAAVFERAVDSLKAVFRKYGYAPIDTPCIYSYETLTGGKAGVDKQLFDWRKGDEGGKHIALRFDLTVPLARYVAANFQKLTFPFKRYDVGKAWRGERPQKGRYREFYQCDFDTVGTTAATADLETALVMADSVAAAGAERFVIHLNDRQILNGLLESLGLLAQSEKVLRVVDKLDKIGEPGVRAELTQAPPVVAGSQDEVGLGLSQKAADEILAFTSLSKEKQGDDLWKTLEERFSSCDRARKGIERLRFVATGAANLRGTERFQVDLSIARGLGYYTGTVYETLLTDAPEFGSVCSGGRYDDLASSYTKQRLPGVGASVGLSRLLSALQKIKPEASVATPCPVLIVTSQDVDPFEGVRIADILRRASIGADLFPQAIKGAEDSSKLGKQLKYGDARGHSFAVIVAPDELVRGAVSVKDMKTQKQDEVALEALASTLRSRLFP
ncbi:histidine--tRNA ligase [bacterium]|nr:histidine--tRNA ligase [bacterium]